MKTNQIKIWLIGAAAALVFLQCTTDAVPTTVYPKLPGESFVLKGVPDSLQTIIRKNENLNP